MINTQAATQYSSTETNSLLDLGLDSNLSANDSVMPFFSSDNSTSLLKVLMNTATVALVAISAPTAITEVVAENPVADTFIEVPNYYTYSSHTSDLTNLQEMFQLVNPNDISLFMNNHLELYNALEFVSNQIHKYSDVKTVSLEHYSDLEEGWEKLYILVETHIDDMDDLDSLEDKIFFEALEPISTLTKGKLVLTVS